MYLDISARKLAFILTVSLLLSVSVFVTNAAKLNYFGSTPFFYTIIVGTRYAIDTAIAKIQRSTQMFSATIFNAGNGESRAQAIPVLTYHRIVGSSSDQNNVSIASFRDQMAKLKAAGWQTVTLEQFGKFMQGELELPEKSFLLTFDDGAKESFYPVDPILQAYGYHAVLYIIAASSHTAESTYYLSPQELTWILRTGRWSFGSHSYDGHRPYPTDTEGSTGIFFADRLWLGEKNRTETADEFTARVRSDLTIAKQVLENEYGVPMNTFAFPLGNETGIEGVANFPDGPSITEALARSIYDFGFLQTNNQQFPYNFPVFTGSTTDITSATRAMLATNFLVYRIHVDHDWDGERLLSILENGRPKRLPFEDDFSDNKGWVLAWGQMDIGRNNLHLEASSELSSISTFLDGTALWDDYSFDAAVNWTNSDIFVMGDVINARTYDACVFSPGVVRVQSTINGVTRTLAEKRDARIAFGEGVRVGIRVHDAVIECAWNFASIAEAYERTHAGGIGLQIWNEQPGVATLQVSSVIARPYALPAAEPEQ